jgi:hypothetical protein
MMSPQSHIEELLIQGTCAVWQGGQQKGTAWLLDNEGHLLTAGHLLGTTHPLDEVEVIFMDDSPRQARNVYWNYDHDQGIDWAVLQVVSPLSDRTPLPICLPRNVQGLLKLCGFGRTLVDMSSGKGQFVGPYHPQNKLANRLFGLESQQSRDAGYSGAAIFSEKYNGIVAIQIEGTTVPAGAPHGTTVLAMPLYRIAEVCKELRAFSDALKSSSNEIYSYNVYLSYHRGGILETWLERFFLDELRNWLSLELEGEVEHLKIFFNNNTQRAVWDATHKEAIRRSCCMVAVLTAGYWRSPECLAELESFKARQELENTALTFGVLFHESGLNPTAPKLQIMDFQKHTYVYEGFRVSAKYGNFQDDVKIFARELAELIRNAPSECERFWPVLLPEEVMPQNMVPQVRIGRPSL